MAKTIGIDIYGSHLLVAELSGKAGSPVTVFESDMPQELTAANAESLGKWLRDKLNSVGISSKEAVCILGRDRVTLKSIELPDCPEGELPAMVAFEMEDVWNQPGIEPIIDFQTGPLVDGQREVFVAMVSQPLVEAIEKLMTAAGLNCNHIGLRPHATHFAWQSLSKGNTGNTLFVVPGQQSFDLSIWNNEQLLNCRSLKITDKQAPNEKVVSEIRRTMFSHHSHFPDCQIDRIVVCAPNHYALTESLRSNVGIAVERFDLTEHFTVGDAELTAGIVAAAGAALQQSSRHQWSVDLLNPKEPVVERDRTRSLTVMVGLLALMLPVSGYMYAKRQLSEKQSQITFYANEVNKLNSELSEYKPTLNRHASIQDWAKGETNWLGEMQELAARMPDTTEVYLTSLDMGVGRGKEPATINLAGRTRKAATVTDRNTQLAQEFSSHYSVTPGNIEMTDAKSEFPWRFDVDLAVKPLQRKEYELLTPLWRVALEELSPESGLKRQPLALNQGTSTKPTPSRTESPTPSRSESPTPAASKSEVSKPEVKAEAEPKEKSGPDDSSKASGGEDYYERLRKMSYEEREAEIKKSPKFLQARIRKKLQEGQ